MIEKDGREGWDILSSPLFPIPEIERYIVIFEERVRHILVVELVFFIGCTMKVIDGQSSIRSFSLIALIHELHVFPSHPPFFNAHLEKNIYSSL